MPEDWKFDSGLSLTRFTNLFPSYALCSTWLQSAALGSLLSDISNVCSGLRSWACGGIAFGAECLTALTSDVSALSCHSISARVQRWARTELAKMSVSRWVLQSHGQWWQPSSCGYFCLRKSPSFQRCCFRLSQAVVPPTDHLCLSSPSSVVCKGNMWPMQ